MGSIEFSNSGIEQFPTGSSRGVDRLWLKDPGAKAAYSSNRQFTEGTSEASPLHEALRAMHIFNPPTDAAETLEATSSEPPPP